MKNSQRESFLLPSITDVEGCTNVIEWCWVHSNITGTGSFTVLEHKTKYFWLLVKMLLFIFSKFIHSYTSFSVTVHINKYQQFIITVQSNKQ